jgi:hypothetical protein
MTVSSPSAVRVSASEVSIIELVVSEPSRCGRSGQFSRWRRRSIPVPLPSLDPLGYLAVVRRLITSGDCQAVLATHEQAWLFAAGRSLLPQDAPIVVASIEAFDRVAGKVDFATLLDELHVPQPE